MNYPTVNIQDVHDNDWYWARGKYNYMDHYGQWRAIEGKSIKSLMRDLEFEIVGPIEKPDIKTQPTYQSLRCWIEQAAPILNIAACIVIDEAPKRLDEIAGVRGVLETCPINFNIKK